jgi:pyridoxal/pyridoxine/pyridoxamine kinase
MIAGYKHWRGERLTGEKLRELYEGLVANNLTKYTHVLTGKELKNVINQNIHYHTHKHNIHTYKQTTQINNNKKLN